MAHSKKRAARRATKTTTTTTASEAGTTTTRRRGPATHSQIRLTLDVSTPVGAKALTMAEAIAQLTPSQREGLASAARSGQGWRLVVVFLPSESRDVDEAIRALPTFLQASVASAEKL